MNETIFRNGRLVLRDRVEEGTLVARDGLIAAIDGPSEGKAGIDLEGDWLLPGLVELHTDHLESHYSPRPRVRWNTIAAIQAHDAQIASAGITTVMDAVRVGMDDDTVLDSDDMRKIAGGLAQSTAGDRLRADHFLHLRCEVSADDVLPAFEHFNGNQRVRIVSLMDHTPGQRQFTSLEAYRIYYQGKSGMSDAAFDAVVKRRIERAGRNSTASRQSIADYCRTEGITLASHDDATAEHVAEASGYGVTLAEFPTTIEAAKASRDAGMKVIMGAPNLVRGGSHSGNVSARQLATGGLLDVLSSDYIPLSLMQGAFLLAETVEGIPLHRAVEKVSAVPAETAGLTDRGSLTPGLRADLVQVRYESGVPIVRAVWRQGRRVA